MMDEALVFTALGDLEGARSRGPPWLSAPLSSS